jgi:hypothetical protein
MIDTFVPAAPLNTPVLFLVFNRPDTTKLVFEAIRRAKPPRLYVAADGPREGRKGESERVAEVRMIATSVDWPCEVRALFRDKNLGCKYAVSGAITWFFEHEEQGIILEDDCLPSLKFFPFCEELLNRYRRDQRVGMISGTMFGDSRPKHLKSGYGYSRYPQIWGWATWRSAWLGYDAEVVNWPGFKSQDGFRAQGVEPSWRRHLIRCIDAVYNGRIDTWDYQWTFHCISQGMLCVFPATNLIWNIGFGEGATHTTSVNSYWAKDRRDEAGVSLDPPKFVMPDLRYDSSKAPKNKIRRILGKLMLDEFVRR